MFLGLRVMSSESECDDAPRRSQARQNVTDNSFCHTRPLARSTSALYNYNALRHNSHRSDLQCNKAISFTTTTKHLATERPKYRDDLPGFPVVTQRYVMSNTSTRDPAVPTVGGDMAYIETHLQGVLARLDAVEADFRAFKASAQHSVRLLLHLPLFFLTAFSSERMPFPHGSFE
jgi:hypothetical protein